MLLVLVLPACHESGTWENDPQNLRRAWDIEPPPDLEVLHSWYWRSPHFSREERYYFHFRDYPQLAESFVAGNALVPAPPGAVTADTFDAPRPAWFAPKANASYVAWKKEEGGTRTVLLRDRATREIFVFSSQR